MSQRAVEHAVFGRHVSFVVAVNFLGLLLSAVLMPILTKALGPAQYGIWTLVITAVALATPLAVMGFGDSIVRFLAGENDRNKVREDFFSSLSVVLASSAVCSFIMFLLANTLATSIIKDSAAELYIRLGATLILLNSIFQVFLAFFRTGRNMGEYSLFQLGWSLLQVCLTIGSLALGYKLFGVVTAAILSAVMVNGVALIFILNRAHFSRPRFSNILPYLRWGVPLAPNAAIMWVISTCDRYIVSYFLGTSAAGIYNAAYSIGFYSSFIIFPLGMVLYPYVTKHFAQGNIAETKNYFRYSFKYLMMITIPCAVGAAVLSRPLLLILTTPEFVSGRYIVALAALAAIFFCIYQFFLYVLYLENRTRLIVVLLSASAVLNLALNLLLIPRFGIEGAGIASSLAYAFLGGVTFIVSRRLMKLNLNSLFLLKSVAAAAFMGLIIRIINPSSVVATALSIMAGIAIYLGILILLKGFSKVEMLFFSKFVNNLIR
jgi:O-antigen/teichoic acid export membrane protein